MYYGIDAGIRDFTVCIMNEEKEVIYISTFWKEGLFWFIDHYSPKLITINLPDEKEIDAPARLKTALEIIHKLKTTFDYKSPTLEEIKSKTPNIIVKTCADMFFQKFIRKQILPFHTREGLEQRIYNLKKTGIKVNKSILAKDKNKLRRELGAIIASFTSLSVDKNNFEKVDIEKGFLIVPKYRFVPSTNRIIRKKTTSASEK
jgi:hypothetical protein